MIKVAKIVMVVTVICAVMATSVVAKHKGKKKCWCSSAPSTYFNSTSALSSLTLSCFVKCLIFIILAYSLGYAM